MAARRFIKSRLPKRKAKKKPSKKPSTPAVLCRADLARLSQLERSAYLHKTLLSNIDYYSALARYRHLLQRASEGKIKGKGSMWRKNLRVYFRLTESGLCLLKTGYAKKPKSPV